MLYETFKAIHVFGVVILLGNVIVTAFWKVYADRTRNPPVIAFAQRLVTTTDFVFTGGGIFLMLVGGFGAAHVNDLDPFGTSWLIWGQALFLISGAIWMAVLIPAQIRLARAARRFGPGTVIAPDYWQDERRALVWGIIATLPLIAAIGIMVMKP